MRPGSFRSARHNGGTQQCSLLSTGNPGTNVEQPLALHIPGPADRIREVGVATIYDNVTLFKVGQQQVYKIVHRPAGLYQQHHLPRAFEGTDKLFNGVCPYKILILSSSLQKSVYLFDRAIKYPNRVPVPFHIQHQVLTHNCQSDQSDICFCFHTLRLFNILFFLLWFTCIGQTAHQIPVPPVYP